MFQQFQIPFVDNNTFLLTLKVIDLYYEHQLVELLKRNKMMKRFFAFAAVAALLTVVASCGSSKGGHCEAYGNVDQTENSDLASK